MSDRNKTGVVFNPYNSMTLQSTDTSKILKAYAKNWDNDEAKYENIRMGGLYLSFIDGIHYVISSHEGVPNFRHPIISGDTVLIDARGYTDYDKIDKTIIVKVSTQYRLDMIRATLMQRSFLFDNALDLLLETKLPALVYATAIYNVISTRKDLSADICQKITILSLMYYINKFYPGNYFGNEENADKVFRRYGRELRLNRDTAIGLMSRDIKLDNLEDLCTAIREHTESLSLEFINASILLTLSGRLFHGAGSIELTTVGLDDPATFAALCFTAIEDRGYNKTRIGEIAKIFSSDSKQFVAFVKKGLLYAEERK